ncbi:hypothetical protein DAEQUDRAFT_642865, partial [Daedalea quercina L-15889]
TPQRLICVPNIQHDCYGRECTATAHEHIREEREDTSRTRIAVKHKDQMHFIINLYALHNQHHIRTAVPQHL